MSAPSSPSSQTSMGKTLRLLIAIIFMLVGLAGLGYMAMSEMQTATLFKNYFHWALGAGIVFLGVGAALTAFDGDDETDTPFDSQSKS